MSSSIAEQTEKVLLHHLESVESGIDAILADYADDAVLLTAKGALHGHSQIRPVFEWLIANVFTPASTFTMVKQLVEGEVAYIVWSAESERYRVPFATDTYLIRNGKIVIQTFAAKVEKRGG